MFYMSSRAKNNYYYSTYLYYYLIHICLLHLFQINLNDELPTLIPSSNSSIDTGHFDTWLNQVAYNILDKSTFAKSRLTYNVNLSDIPPFIPPMLRSNEFNTETEKRSVYLSQGNKVEGTSTNFKFLYQYLILEWYQKNFSIHKKFFFFQNRLYFIQKIALTMQKHIIRNH